MTPIPPSQLDRIERELLAIYGSLETPDFHFQTSLYASRPYRGLVDELLIHFFMKETTDINQDVSFAYLIRGDSGYLWTIQLSMVGKYGVLLRLGEHGTSLVEFSEFSVTDKEALIQRIVQSHEILLLDKRTLETHISMRLFYADPENVCIYQALFSDVDFLPWEKRS